MRSIFRYLWIPVVLFLLHSCSVTQEYQSPELIQQDYFRTDSLAKDSLSGDSLTIADISWTEMFTDSLLQEYINKALVNNIDIRVAMEQIKAAEAYLRQSKYAYHPSVSAGLNYTGSILSKNGSQGSIVQATGNRFFDNFDLSANLSWEADIWGKIRSQVEATEASYLQSVAAHKAIKTNLIAAIATTYYQLLAIDEQIEVTQRTIETRKRSLETTEALKEAGVGFITSVAVEQTRAQYLAAQSIIIDLRKQERLLENTLCLLMGDPPNAIQRTDLDAQNITTDLKIGVPVQLLRNRPDVMAAEQNYRYAFEMRNVAYTHFYPSLTIGASAGLQSLQLSNWLSLNSLFANVLGGLTAPLFNRYMLKTQYAVARIQQEQARLHFKGTLLRASKEVSDALYAYSSASDKLILKRQEHLLLEQAIEDSQALLESGFNNFSYLEVLRAQQSALGASLDVINARLAQLRSIVSLYEALGGGWK